MSCHYFLHCKTCGRSSDSVGKNNPVDVAEKTATLKQIDKNILIDIIDSFKPQECDTQTNLILIGNFLLDHYGHEIIIKNEWGTTWSEFLEDNKRTIKEE